MDQQESLAFIREYFHQLFDLRNIDAIDHYLDRDYYDDDIGDPQVDHIQNSKEFLKNLFIKNPTIGVDVKDAISRDNVITAYLEWYVTKNDTRLTLRKGVAIFVLRGKKILKRHTFIYASVE
ncbi:MAG: hypothetical protein CVU39_15230 [Chloroflexi bacterium HGW-Chloroflexi-10]|nr:MAG: hypothetical protein CVU39_15230 [Chloroflexi bacterium HGW-Chloroflexi-10]